MNTVAEMLAQAATPAPKKSSSSTPDVNLPALDEKIKRLVEIKRFKKDLEAEEKSVASDIMAQAEPVRRRLCAQGKFLSSVKLNGLLTYVVMNKYSAVPVGPVAGLDNPGYFTTETKIDVDLDKLTPEALKMLLACGAATVTQYQKPTETLHHAIALDPKVSAAAVAANIKPVSYLKD